MINVLHENTEDQGVARCHNHLMMFFVKVINSCLSSYEFYLSPSPEMRQKS